MVKEIKKGTESMLKQKKETIKDTRQVWKHRK